MSTTPEITAIVEQYRKEFGNGFTANVADLLLGHTPLVHAANKFVMLADAGGSSKNFKKFAKLLDDELKKPQEASVSLMSTLVRQSIQLDCLRFAGVEPLPLVTAEDVAAYLAKALAVYADDTGFIRTVYNFTFLFREAERYAANMADVRAQVTELISGDWASDDQVVDDTDEQITSIDEHMKLLKQYGPLIRHLSTARRLMMAYYDRLLESTPVAC